MFQKILCPVDFSESSDWALDYALAIARRHGGRVSVMHVVPTVLADPELYPYLTEPVLASAEAKERAYHRLGEFVHRALTDGIGADVILEDGDVVEEILRKAKTLEADVVVLGTHGRRGFRRLLLGSVTERILRQSEAPVLSISPGAPEVRTGKADPFQKILCPVDFSPSSLAGLSLGLSLRRESGQLLVLHLVELYLPALGEAAAFDFSELLERQRSQGKAKLEELVPDAERTRTRLETVVLESGSPYQMILKTAEAEHCDLIVMGVAGRSSADILFFGSTANHVVRAATCPVLTVRSGKE